jgi:hypothetical protein
MFSIVLYYIVYNVCQPFQKPIAHHVPAVYDVLPALGFAQQRPGLAKRGGVLAWE